MIIVKRKAYTIWSTPYLYFAVVWNIKSPVVIEKLYIWNWLTTKSAVAQFFSPWNRSNLRCVTMSLMTLPFNQMTTAHLRMELQNYSYTGCDILLVTSVTLQLKKAVETGESNHDIWRPVRTHQWLSRCGDHFNSKAVSISFLINGSAPKW